MKSKEVGRRLGNIEDDVDSTIKGFQDCTKKCYEKLVMAAKSWKELTIGIKNI